MSEMMSKRMLVIGYGNPGRLDDGLGPAMAAALEQCCIEGVEIDSDYQLTVEDAAQIANVDLVVFIDASTDGKEPFDFYPIKPKEDLSFSTHHISPEAVVDLAANLFDSRPSAYMLSIRGYEFNHFEESLSMQARDNLEAALEFTTSFLRQQREDNCVIVG